MKCSPRPLLHPENSSQEKYYIQPQVLISLASELLEQPRLVTLHNKTLVVLIVQLVVKFLQTLRTSRPHVLQSRRKTLVPLDLLIENLPELVVLTISSQHQQPCVDLTTPQTILIVSLLQLLYLVRRPTQIQRVVVFTLTRTVATEQPLRRTHSVN